MKSGNTCKFHRKMLFLHFEISANEAMHTYNYKRNSGSFIYVVTYILKSYVVIDVQTSRYILKSKINCNMSELFLMLQSYFKGYFNIKRNNRDHPCFIFLVKCNNAIVWRSPELGHGSVIKHNILTLQRCRVKYK